MAGVTDPCAPNAWPGNPGAPRRRGPRGGDDTWQATREMDTATSRCFVARWRAAGAWGILIPGPAYCFWGRRPNPQGDATVQTTILVVDDEPTIRALLRALLRGEADVILEAATGDEAEAIAARELPDLILLDVMLPGHDGYEVCRRLKADPATRHIPVILHTALHGSQEERRGLAVGAAGFLTKPADRRSLLARVRLHLAAAQLTDAAARSREELERQRQALAERRAATRQQGQAGGPSER